MLSSALGGIALSPPLTYDEALTGVLESMVTRPEFVQSVAPSSLATMMGSELGQRPIGAQGQDSGCNQGEEELWFCWKGRGGEFSL